MLGVHGRKCDPVSKHKNQHTKNKYRFVMLAHTHNGRRNRLMQTHSSSGRLIFLVLVIICIIISHNAALGTFHKISISSSQFQTTRVQGLRTFPQNRCCEKSTIHQNRLKGRTMKRLSFYEEGANTYHTPEAWWVACELESDLISHPFHPSWLQQLVDQP